MSKSNERVNVPDVDEAPPAYQETPPVNPNYASSSSSAPSAPYPPPIKSCPTTPSLYPQFPQQQFPQQQYPQQQFPPQHPQQQFPQQQHHLPFPQPFSTPFSQQQLQYPTPYQYNQRPSYYTHANSYPSTPSPNPHTYRPRPYYDTVNLPPRVTRQNRRFPIGALFFLFGCLFPPLWIIGACCCASSRNEYEAWWGKVNFIFAMVLIMSSILWSIYFGAYHQ
ncbi:hypothetical protein BDB01DRAFT_802494 [Pilobolus umbonatus]|nr:hypothetical protein BDB01DRAFT_802494 [Pilobolus umbonatus]